MTEVNALERLDALAAAALALAGKIGWDRWRGNGVGQVKRDLGEHVKDETVARAALMTKLSEVAENVAFIRGRLAQSDVEKKD